MIADPRRRLRIARMKGLAERLAMMAEQEADARREQVEQLHSRLAAEARVAAPPPGPLGGAAFAAGQAMAHRLSSAAKGLTLHRRQLAHAHEAATAARTAAYAERRVADELAARATSTADAMADARTAALWRPARKPS